MHTMYKITTFAFVTSSKLPSQTIHSSENWLQNESMYLIYNIWGSDYQRKGKV